jgi:hydroxypyruvate reductase
VVQSEQGELTVDVGRLHRDLSAIFRAAVAASNPTRLLESALASSEHRGFLSHPLHVLSVGKASAAMAAVLDASASCHVVAGLAIGPPSGSRRWANISWLASGHPVPDERSLEAGRRALALARGVPSDHRLLSLLSGGASSLMAMPRAGITLEDKRETTGHLLRAGADIDALNTVRKHLSAIKGGQLAAAASAPVLTIAISDVIGDDLSLIGSGPTVADSSTYDDALAVLARFGGLDAFPPAVMALLEAGARGELPETPKPGDPRLANSAATVIGSRRTAALGAATMAKSLGYATSVCEEPVTGIAREAGPRFVHGARRGLGRVEMPVCIIATGETTVRVTGGGRGGRNQELVLAAATSMSGLGGPAALLSGGTDGIDGPTDAAGAICDSTTIDRAGRAGLRAPDEYLADNDAYRFFEALGDLVVTGPTGTNVGDILVLLVGPTS